MVLQSLKKLLVHEEKDKLALPWICKIYNKFQEKLMK